MAPVIDLLTSPNWTDYELLDSGDGQKLERFGPYTFVRPEVQALWTKTLPAETWQAAHAVFQPSGEESGGHWAFQKKVPEQWEMSYPLTPGVFAKHPFGAPERRGELRFSVMTPSAGRHLGVFPECAAHWDWIGRLINDYHGAHREHGEKQKGFSVDLSSPKGTVNSVVNESSVNVLNLFGYTGLASLACAAAGAKVTHVDASKKSVSWARANQILSGLAEKPVRWIVDDALKFVEREARRGVKYDGILLDPPKFGRGPKGEVWEVYKSLPELLQACRAVLSDRPLFVVLTVYAVKLPAIHAYSALAETMKGCGGELECGELVTEEKSAGRLLSQAVYARWNP
ncbi:MAG: class I SAM-dependent methyltransferase [Anaerolineales bacterium]